MDKEMQTFLQQKMEEESEAILKAANDDPELADIELPEELHDELFAKIRAYEDEKAYNRLSEEERELIYLGTVYKRRRRRTKYYILVAALIATMAFGVTSMGGPEKLMEIIKRNIAGREQLRINTDDKTVDEVRDDKEEEAYQQIEEQMGVKPVRVSYLPQGTMFQYVRIDETTQNARMIYDEKEKCRILYRMTANYTQGSHSVDIEDDFLEAYRIQKGETVIHIRKYVEPKENTNRWSADFEYQNVWYLLVGYDMEQTEFEKILQNLRFF